MLLAGTGSRSRRFVPALRPDAEAVSPKNGIAALLIEDDSPHADEIQPSAAEAEAAVPCSQTAVVSAGTVFEGDIATPGHLQVQGVLKGSAKAGGNIVISGKIEGNVSGNCISLENCTVRGDISAAGELCVGRNAAVLGNLCGKSVSVGGKVRGSVAAEGAAVLRAEALVLGDVSAKVITLQEGCALFGAVKVLSREKDALSEADFQKLIDEKGRPE